MAIGNNAVRVNLMGQLGAADWGFATVVHPRAIVAPSAVLGAGSAVMAGAIVGTEARLGVGELRYRDRSSCYRRRLRSIRRERKHGRRDVAWAWRLDAGWGSSGVWG